MGAAGEGRSAGGGGGSHISGNRDVEIRDGISAGADRRGCGPGPMFPRPLALHVSACNDKAHSACCACDSDGVSGNAQTSEQNKSLSIVVPVHSSCQLSVSVSDVLARSRTSSVRVIGQQSPTSAGRTRTNMYTCQCSLLVTVTMERAQR